MAQLAGQLRAPLPLSSQLFACRDEKDLFPVCFLGFLSAMKTAAVIVCLVLALLRPSLGAKSLYDLTALDAMRNEVSLQKYRGQVKRAFPAYFPAS